MKNEEEDSSSEEENQAHNTGAKVFAVVKGAAGIDINVPHRYGVYFPLYFISNNFSETPFFGYDSESEEYNVEAHRDRIFGKYVAEYTKSLKEDDGDTYKRRFSKFIAAGVTSEGVSYLNDFACNFLVFSARWCLQERS
jgi:large subunit ribosomal protein L5e